MKPIITLILALLITACASHDGRGLKPGVSNLDEVVQLMGEPAMRWQELDGGQLLAYPRGPAGFNTFMVTIGPDGRMTSLHGVLNMKTFALIREGMTQEQVLRILGPSVAAWTIYFERRDELVWEWRYCDPWNEPARFNVLFDNTTKKVRTTQGYPEGKRFREWCGNELQ
jgi:hypothetical protein